jgi:hypothetical protein
MPCCAPAVSEEAELVDTLGDAVKIPTDRGFDERLEEALKAELHFYGVDLGKFDPDRHENKMKDLTKENLRRIAEVLKQNPQTCIKILGYCGPPVNPLAMKLSLQRTRLARKFLEDLGCKNNIAAYPMGFVQEDEGGARVEMSICTADQVEHLEAEVELMFCTELPVTFFNPSGQGEDHRVVFKSHPLGLRFRVGQTPITLIMVDKNSPAEALGCTPGWRVKEINDRNVVKYTYEETYHRIMVGSKALKMNNAKN